jgi:ribonuclease HI
MNGVLYTDGGARGNPGPAGIGYVLTVGERESITHAEYIGETTNNQAEYWALIKGVEKAQAEGVRALLCYLDSELLVRQLSGAYQVKDSKLKPLFVKVQGLRRQFERVDFRHVLREKNKEADRLVNKAINGYLKRTKR